MFDAPKVSMLRVQASPACNLNCRYCYIPAEVRRQPTLMSMTVFETVLRRLVEENLLEGRLAISWHGAEPLIVGQSWFEEASACISERLGGIVDVVQVFQSNGVLIDDRWCEYFIRHGAHVGISLDGSEAQNRARVNWAGRPTHHLTLRGIERLNRHGLRWTLLSVVTQDAMDDPEAFIDFVRSTGCATLGFKVEETNVSHSSQLEGFCDVEERYAAFVKALWRAFPPGGGLQVREFAEYRRAREDARPVQALPVTLVPFRNLTVGAGGAFTIFAGELLFRDDDRFVFGNVMDGPLLDCLKTPLFRDMSAEMLAGVKRCASTCAHYADCGSFYVSQKYAENGTFDAAETLACRLEVKTLCAALDEVAHEG